MNTPLAALFFRCSSEVSISYDVFQHILKSCKLPKIRIFSINDIKCNLDLFLIIYGYSFFFLKSLRPNYDVMSRL